MVSPKLNLRLNNEAVEIIALAAKKMGTSKRNIISLALVEILNYAYDKRFIDSIANEIRISISTVTTVSCQVQEKIELIHRHGYSRRVYFGLLISDYFLHNQDKFKMIEDQDELNNSKGHIEMSLDTETKAKIINYCGENALTVSSLFSHYILHKDIEADSYEVRSKTFLNLILSDNVKEVLRNKANSTNRTYRFYLNLIAEQIIRDNSI